MPMNLHRQIFAGQALAYLLRDEFITTQAAPLGTPRTCEPGPGQLKITDSTNKISITGGALVIADGLGSNTDPSVWANTSFARVLGRTYKGSISNSSSSGAGIGLPASNTGDTNPCGFAFSGSGGGVIRIDFSDRASFDGILTGDSWSSGVTYKWAIVLRGAGAFFFLQGGAYSTWTLIWVAGQVTSTPLYPKLMQNSIGGSPSVDYIRLADLSAFVSDTSIATLNVTNPATATNYAGDADAVIDLTVTSPGALTGPMELRYRYLDANNYWTAYFDNTGAFKVDSVVGGTPTNRVSVASVAVISHTYTIRVICKGNVHAFYTLDGTVWTRRGSTVTVTTAMDAIATVRPVLATNWSMSLLMDYARQSGFYSILDSV